MSWSLKEAVNQHATDPRERETTEQVLEAIGDTAPEKTAYWQAVQNNDVTTVDTMLTHRAIARVKERLRSGPNPANEAYLKHLEAHLEKQSM